MKHLTIILAFTVLSSDISAQITITQADMPQAGASFFTTNAAIDLTIDPVETGPNHSWNFQQVTPLTTSTDTFYDYSGLPLIYQFFFFGANLADKTAYTISFDQITLEDVYLVYKNSSAAYEQFGYAGTFEGIPVPIVYSSNDVIYNFPLQFGDADSSESAFEFGLPGFGYISQQRTRVNTVDGWGTVTTPVGTFDVLRMRSAITDIDSIFIDTLNYGTNILLKSYEYKWLAQGTGLPVFQINAQDILGVPLVTQISYLDTALQTNVQEIKSHIGPVATVFPNPAGEWLQLHINKSIGKPLTVIITNPSGSIVHQQNIVQPTMFINVSSWKNGIYFLELMEERAVQHLKVLIQH